MLLRSIRSSLGRYLAILAIVALGVGFFAGLKSSQPAMQSAVTLGSAAAAAGLAPVSQTHNAIANGVSYS